MAPQPGIVDEALANSIVKASYRLALIGPCVSISTFESYAEEQPSVNWTLKMSVTWSPLVYESLAVSSRLTV